MCNRLLLSSVTLTFAAMFSAAPVHYPAAHWESRGATEMGVDEKMLDQAAEMLGGRGCIIRNGYVIKAWGDQALRGDWYSSAKPVLSTLLFFAIEEGLVRGVDQPIAEFCWTLSDKDRGITFRHLGSMTSGYARPEGAGAAWAYNDYAIQLYQKTLFDKVFREDPSDAAQTPTRLGALGFEDGLAFDAKRRRLSASVRDFGRIVWFWMNHGRWGDKQILPASYFEQYMRPQTPRQLPVTQKAETDDYLGIGTYGGDSDHFSSCGPGIYGFNWWFNGHGGNHPGVRTWPDAPPDTVMSVGAKGNCSVMMAGLGIAVVCAEGKWGELDAGNRHSKMNRVLAQVARAAGYAPGKAEIAGTLKKWYPLTLSFEGPETREDGTPNPFTDYRLQVTFRCAEKCCHVPGYFAADGDAAESGAAGGRVWRVYFTPDEAGEWTYTVSFREGEGIATALEGDAGRSVAFDGATGSFVVGAADANAPGFLGKGALQYVGKPYLQFAETKEYYLKGGADSPENFLAFADFDGTTPTHRYEPHAGDWKEGQPTWRGGKGKNIIGALNYLAGKRMNSVYFLTMNVEGDGKDVWPWTDAGERFRFDCSKLDQWEIVFSHMDRAGLMLHVLTQETENDQLLDRGDLGPERKLYYREMVARFAHHPALQWNLGEENTNTDEQRKAFAEYIRALDPYDHPIVVHTFPNEYEKVYRPLLGEPRLDGPSLQMNDMTKTHRETLKWVIASAQAGHPWFVCLDEIGPAEIGVIPDTVDPSHDEPRRYALWGNLMAGGAGCEWYFGNRYKDYDITCEDWRSRDTMWDQTFHAINFFHRYVPFSEMRCMDKLVDTKGAWCLANPPAIYVVYVPRGNGIRIEIGAGDYSVDWFNPRKGGDLVPGRTIAGPGKKALGTAPSDADKDWVVLIRRQG